MQHDPLVVLMEVLLHRLILCCIYHINHYGTSHTISHHIYIITIRNREHNNSLWDLFWCLVFFTNDLCSTWFWLFCCCYLISYWCYCILQSLLLSTRLWWTVFVPLWFWFISNLTTQDETLLYILVLSSV